MISIFIWLKNILFVYLEVSGSGIALNKQSRPFHFQGFFVTSSRTNLTCVPSLVFSFSPGVYELLPR